MRLVALSLCLLVVLFGTSLGEGDVQTISAGNSNFGLVVSNQLISNTLNAILPPIIEQALTGFGTELPQDCCYHSKAHHELMLKNMAIPPDSISTSVSVSDGPKIDAHIDFDITLYYKLCADALVGCQVVFPCEGDATLGMKTKTKFDLRLEPGVNGGPYFHFHKFDFHLDIDKKGVCFLLRGLLDSVMPFLNIYLNIFLPNVLGPLIRDISLPHNFTVPGPLPLNIDWALTDGTANSDPGLSFQGIFDILLKSMSYQKAPFTPTYPLPLASNLIQNDVSLLEITDSLLNNIFFTAYHHFQDFEYDTEQDGFKIKLSFSEQPLVNFTSAGGDQAGVLTFFTHISLTKIPIKIAVTSTMTAHFALLFNDQAQLYLSLDPNDFVVDITSMTPPQPNATKNRIENQIEDAWASFIPGLDETLAAHPFSILPPGSTSPSVTSSDGYATIQFTTSTLNDIANENSIDIMGAFVKSMDKNAVSSAFLRAYELSWESMHSLNPEEELVPLVHTGVKDLSCPNIPLFTAC